MALDHDSGTMTGRCAAGAFAGRALDDLDVAALQKLYAELSPDAESLALFEAYLDRRSPVGVKTSRVMRQRGRAARRMRAP